MDRTPTPHELSQGLDRALELDTVARAQWLAGLDAADPPLARQLRALLANRGRMENDGFLAGDAGSAALLASSTAESAAAPLVGTVLGPWRIEAEIGRGGMGSVWRARRDDGRFDGLAAIKFVNLALLGREGEQRFRREGQLLGRLDHPNIARLLDAGVHGVAQQPYLVLEYVDGQPIDGWCEARGLDARRRVALFVDVLQAVAHAHSHLIIHRDLKPSNILVTGAGVVKLLDFGIARLASADDAAGTRSSAAPMTPQYAAPEQVRGEPVTTRTDVYALGLVLYRLLTGRHAVDGERADGAALLRAILESDPPPPSASIRGRHVDARDVMGDLDNIVARALRKAPAERYASVGALADDLQRFLRDEPVTARPDSLTYRVGKFVRRHRGGVAATALTALALVAATVVTTQQMFEARRQRGAAQFQAERAEASVEFLLTTLLAVDPDGKPLSARQQIDRGVTMLEAQYSDDPGFLGSMLLIYASRYFQQAATTDALALYDRVEALAQRAGETELQVQALCERVFVEVQANRFDQARARLVRATTQLRALREPAADLRIACMRAEATVLRHVEKRPDEALKVLEAARADLERRGDTAGPAYTSVLGAILAERIDRGELREGLALVRQIGAIHERNGRGNTIPRLRAWQNESIVLYRMGEIRTSLERLQSYTERIVKAGPQPFLGTGLLSDRATSLNRLARPQEALPLLDGLYEQAIRDGNPRRAVFIPFEQARALQALGRPRAEITPLLARMRALYDDAGWNAALGIRVLHDGMLVDWDLADGDAEAAWRRVEPLLAHPSMKAPDAVRPRRLVLTLAARVALAQRRLEVARVHAQAALELAERAARGPDTSADVGETLLLLAQAQRAAGAEGAARTSLERAVRCLGNGYGADHPLTRQARELLAAPPPAPASGAAAARA